jgi:hypothetical protein
MKGFEPIHCWGEIFHASKNNNYILLCTALFMAVTFVAFKAQRVTTNKGTFPLSVTVVPNGNAWPSLTFYSRSGQNNWRA